MQQPTDQNIDTCWLEKHSFKMQSSANISELDDLVKEKKLPEKTYNQIDLGLNKQSLALRENLSERQNTLTENNKVLSSKQPALSAQSMELVHFEVSSMGIERKRGFEYSHQSF